MRALADRLLWSAAVVPDELGFDDQLRFKVASSLITRAIIVLLQAKPAPTPADYVSLIRQPKLAAALSRVGGEQATPATLYELMNTPPHRVCDCLEYVACAASIGLLVEKQAKVKERDQCAQCGKVTAYSQKCGRCRAVRYCNAECQREHWKAHKQACKASVARAASAAGAAASGTS